MINNAQLILYSLSIKDLFFQPHQWNFNIVWGDKKLQIAFTAVSIRKHPVQLCNWNPVVDASIFHPPHFLLFCSYTYIVHQIWNYLMYLSLQYCYSAPSNGFCFIKLTLDTDFMSNKPFVELRKMGWIGTLFVLSCNNTYRTWQQ